MATNKPIIRGKGVMKGNEDNSLSSGNRDFIDEQNKVMIRNHLKLYNKDANSWKQKYGGANSDRAESILLELSRDLNFQNSDKAVQGEEEVGALFADKVENTYMNADPNEYGNSMARFGKGGVRGSAIMWNTLIDAGREGFDFENWAILADKISNGTFRGDNTARDKWEVMAENVKRRAMKYGVGGYGAGNPLMELWGKAVSSDYDYRNLLDRVPKDMQGDTSWFKMDIPWENQNLGTAGRFGEILAMEAMTMGPLAAMKLARASHVINYFRKAAGGDGLKFVKAKKPAASQLSKAELDAVDAGNKYTPIKLVTKETKKKGIFGKKIDVKGGQDVRTTLEVLDKNTISELADKGTFIWNPVSTRFWTRPKQTKEAYSKLLDLSAADGRWVQAVPFLGRKGFIGAKKAGGAYREAEIYSSLAAGAGGAFIYDITNGSEWSILGEVAGGVMGARVVNMAIRPAHDIFNSLRFNLGNLNPEQRADAVMRSFGYERAGKDMVLSEIDEIGPEGAGINIKQGEYYDPKSMTIIDENRKNRIVRMATSTPTLFTKGQNAKDRAFLKSLRSMHEMIDSLPQKERQNFHNRLILQDKLFSKFANVADGGRLFTALSKALSMDVLNTVRKKTLGTKTLGHRVKLKLDPSTIALAERELEQTEALIDVMMHFGDEAWGTVGVSDLIVGFKRAAEQSLNRVKEDVGPGGMVEEFINTQQRKLDYLTKMENKNALSSGKADINRVRAEDGSIDIRPDSEMKNIEGQGIKIDFNSDIKLEEGQKTIDELMEKMGSHFFEEEGTGFKTYFNIMDNFSDADYNILVKQAPKLVNNAFRVARGRANREYNKIRNYKDKFSSTQNKAPDQVVADIQSSHAIVDTLGQEIMAIKAGAGDLAESGKLGAFSKRIENFDNLETFLEIKRAELLSNAFKEGKINEQQIAARWEQLAKERKFPRTSVKADPVNGLDEIPVSQQIEDIANNLDVSLKDVGKGYDFSLETMTTMRTDLKQTGFKNLSGTDSLLHKNAHIQMQGAEAISTALDNAGKVSDSATMKDWQNANSFFKTNVADVYYKGVGHNMIARNLRGDKKVGPTYLFDQFIGTEGAGADWNRNAEMFKRMFDIEGVGDNTIEHFSEKSRDLLKKTIKWRAINKKKIPLGFHKSFGGEDLLDYRKEISGSAALPKDTPSDVLGGIFSGGDDAATRALNDQISPVKQEIQELINKEEGITQRLRADTVIKDDFGIEGLNYDDVSSIFGRMDAGEKEVRQLIIDSTYKGGNTRQSDKVYNVLEKRLKEAEELGDLEGIEKYTRGIQGLQRILWDGAMEQAQAAGTKAEGIRLKSTDKFGEMSGSTFESVLNLDASAFNTYVSTNRKLLSKMLSKTKLSDGATMWDKMNDMNSLITLVAGEVPTAAMEGLPKHFRVEQIISRIYSIARGVVSPRYVITELLIQDWRFKQGNLIKDLATDQDASKLLYDIIFTEGLKNPRVRSEFVSKWLNTFIRYNRGNERGDHSNFDTAGESQHITQTKERAGAVADGVGSAYNWGKGQILGSN